MLSTQRLTEILKELRDLVQDYFPECDVTLVYDDKPDGPGTKAFQITINHENFIATAEADTLGEVDDEIDKALRENIRSANKSLEYWTETLARQEKSVKALSHMTRSPMEELARLADEEEENGESS